MLPTDPSPAASGVPQPSEQQARYFRLMKLGWSNNDACKAVRICRKTGSRWRLGRHETRKAKKHSYPPIEKVITEQVSPRFLSAQERVRVADLHRLGTPVRKIAAELGRSASTISRELRRNADQVSGIYLPHTAHRLAAQRRSRPKPTRLEADPILRTFVDQCLAQRHSPEQIRHELTVEFAGDPARQLATETLYQAVYPATTQRTDQHAPA